MSETTEAALTPECYKRHAIIEQHIEEGKGWRGLLIALVLSMIVQVGAFLVMWGSVTRMVDINTKRLDRIENLHFKAPVLER